jgi:tRNA uridine 5-carboxymethylaminomethyl modification enzyme
LLNRSKARVVRGPRTQADRKLYRRHMQAELKSIPGPALVEASGRGRCPSGAGRVAGVVLADGRILALPAPSS